MIKAWFRRLFGTTQQQPPAPRPLSTRQLQAREINQRFGADLIATTVDLRSLDEWLARIAVLEWEYSMRVPTDLWMHTHNEAIDQIHLYRASLRNTVKQHHRRASRIQRASLA